MLRVENDFACKSDEGVSCSSTCCVDLSLSPSTASTDVRFNGVFNGSSVDDVKKGVEDAFERTTGKPSYSRNSSVSYEYGGSRKLLEDVGSVQNTVVRVEVAINADPVQAGLQITSAQRSGELQRTVEAAVVTRLRLDGVDVHESLDLKLGAVLVMDESGQTVMTAFPPKEANDDAPDEIDVSDFVQLKSPPPSPVATAPGGTPGVASDGYSVGSADSSSDSRGRDANAAAFGGGAAVLLVFATGGGYVVYRKRQAREARKTSQWDGFSSVLDTWQGLRTAFSHATQPPLTPPWGLSSTDAPPVVENPLGREAHAEIEVDAQDVDPIIFDDPPAGATQYAARGVVI